MKTRFLLLALIGIGLVACQPEPGEIEPSRIAYEGYGLDITPEGAVPIQAVAAEADAYTDRNIKVEGTIVKVCQKKGCWLTLDAGADQTPIRVNVDKEEDGAYKFTFPKDIDGQRVVIEGYFEKKTISVDMLRHLAEDDGASQEAIDAITEPKDEYWMTASGALVEAEDATNA